MEHKKISVREKKKTDEKKKKTAKLRGEERSCTPVDNIVSHANKCKSKKVFLSEKDGHALVYIFCTKNKNISVYFILTYKTFFEFLSIEEHLLSSRK